VSDKIKTGNKGERLAAELLKSKGYEIVARNYRYGHTEIDIIARKDNWVLFVEVKTRSSDTFGQPEDFVDDIKTTHIFNAAEEWIFSTDWKGHIRFDIISVKLGADPLVEHLQDAIN
jgi:putative endonuclease